VQEQNNYQFIASTAHDRAESSIDSMTKWACKILNINWLFTFTGHPPRAFYYIFSGMVNVTVTQADEDEAKIVCLLDSGESFGVSTSVGFRLGNHFQTLRDCSCHNIWDSGIPLSGIALVSQP